MVAYVYSAKDTAVLLIDPYNDLLSDGGKLHHFAKPTVDAVGTVHNMRRLVETARSARLPIVYVPHHRARPEDFAGWSHPTPHQLACHRQQVFASGTWGGEWHLDFVPRAGDTVVEAHWSSCGFANTDLDLRLKQLHVHRIVLIGMLANTCVEGTGRFGVELGYHVTLVRDATAAFSAEAMHAAHALDGPTYAHAIVTTDEFIAAMSASTG